MSILSETYKLANGVQIPKLGLGTWFINDKDAAGAVRNAVKLGYRLIDTAQAYMNEAGVGGGVRTCGVSREEVFVIMNAKAHGVTQKEIAAAITHVAFYAGWPKAWAVFNMAKEVYAEEK